MKGSRRRSRTGRSGRNWRGKSPGGGGGGSNRPPADKKQRKDLAGLISAVCLLLLLRQDCSIALSLSMCVCVSVRLCLSLSRAPLLCLQLVTVAVSSKSQDEDEIGAVAWSACAGKPRLPNAHLLICQGATVGDGRVGHGEWQQFLCSCSGGAPDPQTRVGLQRVCESGSQSGAMCPGTVQLYNYFFLRLLLA